MPEARIARRNTLVVLASAGTVAVCVVLFAVFYIHASRERNSIRRELREAVAALAAAQLKTAQAVLDDCRRTNVARAQSNAQLRKPLKEMMRYFIQLVDDALERQFKAGKAIPNLERTLAFKARFEMFYRQVTLLKPIDCGHA